MAIKYLRGPSSKIQALKTTFLGAANRFQVQGARRISVNLDDAAIGFTVQMTAVEGSAVDDGPEPILAGGSWWEDIHPGQKWQLDIKADSGTPNATIRVS